MVTYPLCIWALTTSQDNGDLKSSLLSLSVLLTYIVLMTRLDKTKVGGYADVIGRIAEESISPFIVILILLCGFLLAFRNRSVHKDQYKASSFDTVNNFNVSFENSIFQIYSFMVGNIDANDMGLDNLTGPNLVTFGIFIIFLFLIPSLAFNIFTGIAINEIQSLIKDCNIQILKDKIDYIYDGGHSIFEVFDHFQAIQKFKKRFYGVLTQVYKIKRLKEKISYNCTKCRDRLFACAAACWGKVRACRETSVKDVEKAADIIASRDSVETDSDQGPDEIYLNRMAFVDDKYIENFETLENRARNLELRLEDRTRELVDLILNGNNNLPEDRVKAFGPRVEDRTKTLEDKLEERTKTLEKKLEERTKSLEDKLEERTKSLEDKLEERSKKVVDKLRERTKKLEDKLEDRAKKLEDKLNTILEHLTSKN